MRFLALLFLAMFFLQACAPDRSGARLAVEELQAMAPADKPMAVIDAPSLPEPLRKLYASELEKAGLYRIVVADPGEADLQGAVRVHLELSASGSEKVASWWYLGIGLAGPFWPIMPYAAETKLVLDAAFWHNDVVIHRVHLVEKDVTQMQYYGPYRLSAVQKDVDGLHRALAARLAAELKNRDRAPSGICRS